MQMIVRVLGFMSQLAYKRCDECSSVVSLNGSRSRCCTGLLSVHKDDVLEKGKEGVGGESVLTFHAVSDICNDGRMSH